MTHNSEDPDATGTASVPGTFLATVYDRYEDPAFRPLPGAVEQVDELAAALAPFGYRPTVLTNLGQGGLVDALNEWRKRWHADGNHGPAVVAWSGHAEIDDKRNLQLITRATAKEELGTPDLFYNPERLAGQVLSSSADQILILLDTCHSGAGALGAVDHALTAWSNRTLPEPRTSWLGVLAACQAHEKAAGSRGLLLETVLRLLRDGPSRTEPVAHTRARGHEKPGRYRHEWSVRNEGITGDTLAQAAMEDCRDSGQVPVWASTGRPKPIFRNPLWRPRAGEALVEHLVLAARGIDPTEEGWFFTGRRRALEEITAWLAEGAAGMLLLTGSAGAGKSAVAGRIAALAHPEERAAIMEHAPLTKDDPDPGQDSVDAALHLRGMGVQDVAAALADKLGLPEPKTPAGLIADLEGLEATGARRHVLVLDGLDEATPGQAGPIADQLLVPLSRLCTVLLASRDRPFRPHLEPGETLDAALTRTVGAAVKVLDLDQQPDTAADIADYVRKRLTVDGLPGEMAEEVAPVLAERATGSRGGFLFARIVASALARDLAASPDRPWREQIPATISEALTRDLATGTALHRDGRDLPHAADDLLSALAWAAGNGMPAHGVWQTAARAVSRHGTVYGPADIDWLLAHYGRYIVEDSDGHQAVYRLYHRELITHLRKAPATPAGDGHPPALAIVRSFVDLTLEQTAEGTMPDRANPYLQRHLPDHALAAGGPGVTALRQLTEANPDAYLSDLAGSLNNLANHLGAIGRRAEALAPAEEAATLYRTLAHDNPNAHLPNLAMSLNNLANHLGAIGRRAEALAPAEEAATLYRTLAHDNPNAYLPTLAGSLNNLAVHLGALGRRTEALVQVEEAATVCRALAHDNPDAYLPNLATSLNNLAVQLGEIGRRAEALAPAEEAATLYRALAHDNPDAHLPNLATSLNNLAIQLGEIGRRAEALAPAEEAVQLRRTLAHENPDAHLPNLATSLNNLANRLAEIGRRAEALAPAEEAATLYRTLAHDNPDAHLPDLAMSLTNLANRLAEIGRHAEALAPAEEAVQLRRTLANDNPGAYLPNLAGSLNNLAALFGEIGRRAEALALAEEAATLHRTLAHHNPDAHLPNLALSLNNLAVELGGVGRRGEALAQVEEAASIYRSLARANPDAYLPNLAGSLNNLAALLGEIGRHEEAFTPAEEAVQLRRTLARANPAAYLPDLAGSLNNLANHLGAIGQHEEALTPAEEAATLYRTLARNNPDAHLPDLAMSLNNLANRLAGIGRHEEALAPAEEAVQLRRTLARANPGAHLPDLAVSLNNLANHLGAIGQHEEALTPAEEAATLYRTLAHENPDAHLPNLATSLNNLANRLAEIGRRGDALRLFEEVIDSWHGQSTAVAQLSYSRAVFVLEHGETTEAVEGLCALLTSPAGLDGPTAFQVRQVLRRIVKNNPAQREVVMHFCGEGNRAVDPSAWLDVSETALKLTADWINTDTWAASRAFLEGHTALLDAASGVALREWARLHDAAAGHVELLDQVVAGVPGDVVYRPLLLTETLIAWIRASSGDGGWAGSAAFLAEHVEDLLAPDADGALAGMDEGPQGESQVIAVHRAVLAMAAADGIEAAYGLLEDRQVLHARVQQALEAADGQTLAWLAVVEGSVFDASWTATVHWLAARALDDAPNGAVVRAARQAAVPDPGDVLAAAAHEAAPTAEERNRAVAELASLLSARPSRAAALSAVLQAVLAVTAPELEG
ncbi:tetratricopeptide repeat protein [Streptomyces sp. NPDC051555]|uniref:tetratricopeptide repeat protein n=1 Tax=Streptomyces sp. NPDC051555 TaxID=3365657 RepID=UPI0037A14C26